MGTEIKAKLVLQEDVKKPAESAQNAVNNFIKNTEGNFKKLQRSINLVKGAGLVVIGKEFIRVGRAVASFGKTFIDTAASMEQFQIQLEAISNTEAQAQRMFRSLREFARTSPLETEDVVQSFVRLRAVGISPTMTQFKTLGSVALIFGQQMTDVLDGFVGMNKRTLRTLGIDIDRTGEKAIIQSGEVRKVVTKDSHSIRQALIETWEERFPNLLEKASKTTKARVAIMKSEFLELRDAIGKKLLPVTKKLVDTLGKMAKKVREAIEPTAEKRLIAINKQMKDLQGAIRAANVISRSPVGKGGLVHVQEAARIDELKEQYEKLRKIKLRYILLAQIEKRGPGGTGKLGTEDLEEERKKRIEKEKKELQTILDNMAYELSQYKKTNRERIKTARELAEAERQLRELVEKEEQASIDRRIRNQQRFANSIINLTTAMTDTLTSLLVDNNVTLKKVLKSNLNLLIDFIGRKVIIAKVSATLDAAIKAAGGVLAPAAIAEAAGKIALINTVMAVAKAGVASFADGVTNLAFPTFANVGERGPERMIVPAGASILPNHDRTPPMGGPTFNIKVIGTLSEEEGKRSAMNFYSGLRNLERTGKLAKGWLQ